MTVIPGLHANIFSVTRALQKVFQVTSEGETLILKKKSTRVFLQENCKQRWQRIHTGRQVLQKRKQRHYFIPQEAKSGRGGSRTSGRDSCQEAIEYNNQATRDAEILRQQTTHEARLSQRR